MLVTCLAVQVAKLVIVMFQGKNDEVKDNKIRPRTRSRGNNDQDGTQSMFRLGRFSSAGGSPDHQPEDGSRALNARGSKEAGRAKRVI